MNKIEEQVRNFVVLAFMDETDELKINNAYIEYDCADEPIFDVVKDEPGKDPKIYGGKPFFVSEYVSEYKNKWMKTLIKDLYAEVQNIIG